MCCCDEHEIANCKLQTENCKFEIRNAQFAILAFTLTLSRRLRGRRSRRGQALVEFAIVALVVYLLLGAILTFGQWFYSGQTVQQAADVAAREISRTPLSAMASLMDVLYSNNPSDYSSSGGSSTVRTSLFNPQLLQFDMTAGVPAGQSVLDVVQTWPIVNQMLYPAMIVQSGEQVYGGNAADLYLCYPGVVPCTDSTNPNRTVYCVARVDSRAADGAETITWVPVIEEITPEPPPAWPPFDVRSTQRGLVALRINYGYQSASMSAFPPSSTYPPSPNAPAWVANDNEVAVNPSNYTPISAAPPSAVGTYSGPYGLGTQEAWAGWTQKDPVPPSQPLQKPAGVRPYRSLISAQAIYRREVYQ